MSVKPENDAGVIALLRVMERETAQEEMLGALGMLMDIDDAYVRQESVVAGTDCAMSRIFDSTAYISVLEAIHHYETGSDDINNNDKLDMSETHKEIKSIDHNKCVLLFAGL